MASLMHPASWLGFWRAKLHWVSGMEHLYMAYPKRQSQDNQISSMAAQRFWSEDSNMSGS